ncbi:hypothetical protein BKA70DRAFT_1253784 [Coprinopsis sp. MPI-PUGE-AT-0042]|nr:hypothetical protein BKA70DRAFT_1253784 [Coprinopsis sp. MPI-PUGE-AT-0042]
MVPTCSICFGEFNEPVSIPCGHIYCFPCLNEYANGPTNEGLSIPCPHCRQEFQLVTPDPRTLPRKYHPFIQPHIRRVFIDAPPPNETTQELKRQIKALTKTVDNLRKREDTLMRECERHVERANAYREREQGARQELMEMEQGAIDAEDRVMQAEERAEEAEGRAEEAEEKFQIANAGMQRIAAAYDDLRPKYRVLKRRNKELQDDLEASRAEEETARQATTTAEAARRQADQQVRALSANHDAMIRRCRELEIEAMGFGTSALRCPKPSKNASSDSEQSDGSGTESEEEDVKPVAIRRKPTTMRVETPPSDRMHSPSDDGLQLYEPPARIRVKRPLPRRARPLSEDDEQPQDTTRKRPRYSEPVFRSTSRLL